MKRLKIYTVITGIFLLYLINISCSKDKKSNDCNIIIDSTDFTFGTDYNDPGKYLIPGEESDLSDEYLEEIRSEIGTPANDISGILEVCHWFNQTFSFENAGGSMMGVNTIDELYELKKFYGCHSAALIISSVVREFGFPALMIETAGIQWAYDYNAGETNSFSGHVMTEIYAEDKWILFDINCTYVEDYDPMNPFIPLTNGTESQGYFVFAKGIDIWDYTGKDESFTRDNLLFFSENIRCYEELFHTVSYSWKN